MAENSEPEGPEADPLEMAILVDKICDQFESIWKAGEQPTIEEFLIEVDASTRKSLLTELIRVDICYRRKRGESPSPQEYLQRYQSDSLELSAIQIDDLTFDPKTELPNLVAQYELQELIGEGTFGAVWKAWDRTLRRFAAVKLPKRSAMWDSSMSRLFEREAISAAKCRHSNLVSIYGAGFADGVFYIASEYVDGPTLQQQMKVKAFGHLESASLVERIAGALSVVHSQNIVHRDIKPGNILVNPQGEPMLTDFGLAKWIDSQSTIGGSGIVVGTYPYMSPEQATGKPVDARSDVMSLGIVLYELITKSRPFHGDRDAVLYHIVHTIPTPPRNLDATIPLDLEAICWKAIQKNPSKRYQSAADLCEDLARLRKGIAPNAKDIGRFERVWIHVAKWPRQFRILLTVLLLLLFGAAIAYFIQSRLDVEVEHNVQVLLSPKDATFVISPIDSESGLPDVSPSALIAPQHGSSMVRLYPGQYRVTARVRSQAIGQRSRAIEVVRTVPFNPGSQPGSRNFESHKVLPNQSIEWPPIDANPASVPHEMVLIPGTSSVNLGDANSEELPLHKCSIRSFLVARKEFTYEDFAKLPEYEEPHKRMSQLNRSLSDAMSVRFDEAVQWAEKSGCRLLTEKEFEYLARLVHAAHSNDIQGIRSLTKLPDKQAAELRSSLLTIEAIFDGQAEWLWGTPQGYVVAAERQHVILSRKRSGSLYHILRGGNPSETIHTGIPQWFELSRFKQLPQTLAPGCGFRLASQP